MYLVLKPLTVSKVFNERVKNYCRSNEFIRMKVITGKQKFFINETMLFCHGNRDFDAEWRKNELLQSCDAELLIYRREKINPEELLQQKISTDSIGKIEYLNFESNLYFEVFLNEDSFLSLDKELSTNFAKLEFMAIDFENPDDESENKVGYISDSDADYSRERIFWKITNEEKHNYLKINEIDFKFNRIDIEEEFYDYMSRSERESESIESDNRRLQHIVTTGVDESMMMNQIQAIKNSINDFQSGVFMAIKTQILIITLCVLFIALKVVL